MKSLEENLNKKFQIKKGVSERGNLIERFHERLNREREGTKYGPLSIKRVAIKVGHLRTPDLYHLMKICENGDNFSKVFWGSLKNKKT